MLPILLSASGFADSLFQVLQCCFKFWVWHIGLWQKAASLSDLPISTGDLGSMGKCRAAYALALWRDIRTATDGQWRQWLILTGVRLPISAPRNLMLSTPSLLYPVVASFISKLILSTFIVS
jgi:hypothetical protein